MIGRLTKTNDLRTPVAILIVTCFAMSARGQHYLRGEIRDEMNNTLSNVRIVVQSSGYNYYSGSAGGFGITLPNATDSLSVLADGYLPFSARVNADVYQMIVLKMRYKPAPKPLTRLMSRTKNLTMNEMNRWTVGAETYSSLVENAFVPASRFPETGFALNVNKASYSNIRRFLNMDNVVPPDAVRIEEMLNYFHFGYISPLGDSTFTFRSAVSGCPWNAASRLLYLQVCARKANMDSVPPANLVFLIDVSGSMDLPNRLPLLKSAFSLMVNNLRAKDTVSIVVYGGVNGVWLPPTSGDKKEKIQASIEQLEAGGATPGESGIRAAYRLAKSTFIKGGNNRVILATDGDFNVGQQSDEELDQLINSYRSNEIYLTCLGVGMGNYKDSKLEVLARRGNGNFAYLDNEKEAEKVLMEEFAETVYAVARDAFMDVRFDTTLVENYRLIGFDNKLSALSDTSTRLQGGELGSGHSLIALFELKPGPAWAGDSAGRARPIASATLRYQRPGDSLRREIAFTAPFAPVPFQRLSPAYRFAGAMAMFGGLLRRSPLLEKGTWEEMQRIAAAAGDPNDIAQKESLELIEKAKKIYAREKKRHKKNEADGE